MAGDHHRGSNVDFQGRKVVITGKLLTMKRSEAESKLSDLGATVVKSVSAKTDFLIVGSNPGSKLSKAEQLGITVLPEEILADLPGSSENPAPNSIQKGAKKENSGPVGKTVVLAGTLKGLKRDQAQRIVEEAGAWVASKVSKDVDLVVAGSRAGKAIETAQKFGIEVIDQARFLELFKTSADGADRSQRLRPDIRLFVNPAFARKSAESADIIDYPPDLEPQNLYQLAKRDRDGLLHILKTNENPLAHTLAILIEQHWETVVHSPEQFAQQLRARLPLNGATRGWIAAAEEMERKGKLRLRSNTLEGPHRPILWTRKHHSNLVHGMVVLPDGDRVVSAGEDGKLLMWNLGDGEKSSAVTPLKGHRGPVNDVALSPDGAWMATAGDDQTVGLWSVRGSGVPKKKATLRGHHHYIRSVVFGRRHVVSVSQDGTARIWALPTGKLLRTLKHGQDAMSVAISPSDSFVATTTINSAMYLWDLRTGRKLGMFYGNEEQVMHVMSGVYLGGTNRSGVGHKDYPRALTFIDDSTLLSMGSELLLWDVGEKKEKIRHPSTTRFSANALCWLDRDHVAIAEYGVILARVREGGEWLSDGEMEKIGVLGVGCDNATSLCVLEDGKTLLSGHRDGSVRAWDLTVDMSQLPEAQHGGSIWNLDTSPSGRYLVSKAADNSVCLWDGDDGSCLDQTMLTDPNSYDHWFAFSRDEKLYALGEGKAWIQVRHVSEGGELKRIRIKSDKDYQAISALAFSTEPNVLFAGIGSGGLFRVEFGEPEQTIPFQGYSHSPSLLWITDDGKTLITEDFFANSEDESDWKNNVSQILGWDLKSLERKYRIDAQKLEQTEYKRFGKFELTEQGLLTLSGKRKQSLVLRDPTDGSIQKTFSLPVHYFYDFRVLEDGLWFFFIQPEKGDNGRATIFDPERDRIVTQVEDPEGWHTRCVSSDGRLGVRACKTQIDLYELSTSEVLARFVGDNELSYSAFNRDGTRIYVGDRGGLIHVLELSD